MFVGLGGISAMPKFRKLFNSLQFQLIFWSVLSLLLLAIVAGGYGFWYSYNEINDFQDDNLKNTAALLEQSFNMNGLNSNTAALDNEEHTSSNIHFDTDDDDGAITVDIVILSALLDDGNGVEDYQSDPSDDEHDYSERIEMMSRSSR
jgi:two-component system, OmpR family, sensor kinase